MFNTFVNSVKSSEWAQFLDYLSPAFFEVVPTLDIARLSGQMGKTFAKRQHNEEEQAVRELMHALRLPVEFRNDKGSADMVPSLSRKERSRIVLSIFFGQILAHDFAWLDLRLNTFELLSREMIWKPMPWIIHWDPVFLAAIREVLGGLFHDDRDLFEHGLDSLNLGIVSDELYDLLHTDQALPFSQLKFRDAVHDIFVVCKKSKLKLHPHFFPFGLYLSAVWEHLGSLNENLKVGPIFDAVWQALDQEKSVPFEALA